MGIPIADSLDVQGQFPIDGRSVKVSVNQAFNDIPSSKRYRGLRVTILDPIPGPGPIDYWFKGGIGNEHFVPVYTPKTADEIKAEIGLDDYAKKTELANKADKTELNDYVKTVVLNDYTQKTELNNYAKKVDLDDYIKNDDIDGIIDAAMDGLMPHLVVDQESEIPNTFTEGVVFVTENPIP